jgi:hypothetical protein
LQVGDTGPVESARRSNSRVLGSPFSGLSGQRYTLVINHIHYVDTVCVHFSPESAVINDFYSKTGA